MRFVALLLVSFCIRRRRRGAHPSLLSAASAKIRFKWEKMSRACPRVDTAFIGVAFRDGSVGVSLALTVRLMSIKP